MDDNVKTYHTRNFLNPLGQCSYASVHCFHGFMNPDETLAEFKGRPVTTFTLSGCHSNVTLHKTSSDTRDFIQKLRILAEDALKFADWIETELLPEEGNDTNHIIKM